MKAIILSASEGRSMHSQTLLGKTITQYMCDACVDAGISTFTVSEGQSFMNGISSADEVILLDGNMPLITGDFLRRLCDFQKEQQADAVTVQGSLGDHSQSVYLFHSSALADALAQHACSLADAPAILRDAGRKVAVFPMEEDPTLLMRVNTEAQLACAVDIMRQRINLRHMANGVRMINPASVFIDDIVKLEPGVTLYPGVILEGRCHIAGGAVIGPDTRMTDTTIGADTTVQYSVLMNAAVGRNTEVGPFAYLRPGAEIGDHCKVGDFVEVKNARVGNHTKASHLAYIGDAEVGSHVNFSCGAITVNYNGEKKQRTIIGDHVFVGCNSNLIAPVTIDENAFVAAGSTITHDVPSEALAIARERQTVKPGWVSRDRQSQSK